MIAKIPSHFVILWIRIKKELDIKQINSFRRGASWQWIPTASSIGGQLLLPHLLLRVLLHIQKWGTEIAPVVSLSGKFLGLTDLSAETSRTEITIASLF